MSKKIMIVDDDPSIVEYLTDLFHDNGFATCSAIDSSDALDIVTNEMPDLITLDIEMPGEWGPRFYRRISQDPELRDIPIIVVSGLTGVQHAVNRAVAVVPKPFDPQKLLCIVKETLGDSPAR
ncbi:DVU0259 family response regulator domain-containing protein [Desulfobaculum bizertense]|uniref:Response regulator receiver domain-containing protein n=1 Tax=Desulfobaculum bizertense DSM 18034 TaxID=1121442 RepID=A0A1T4VG89_9BACT|nr:response regulator [Desulfobaculum bizertense]UIJ37776.1 response regulator [Desulfobaculum bizertense]SKA63982.1 Response regulator receiver domain-containing protein [Desulfobaculum bizertense DSM 18034]